MGYLSLLQLYRSIFRKKDEVGLGTRDRKPIDWLFSFRMTRLPCTRYACRLACIYFEEKGLIKMIDGSVVKHEPNLVSSKGSNTVASVYFMEKKRWQG